MARRRFFVNEVRRGEAVLNGDEAEHLSRVLRAEAGQKFEICDGLNLYLGEILEARKRTVKFRIVETLPVPEPPVKISLMASLIKFERFEWLIEKATELGVDTIIPVQAERSEKGLELAAQKRIERWGRVARAASQQARRVHLPNILPPIAFRQAIRAEERVRFYLEETPGHPSLLSSALALPDRRAGEKIAVLVGPEGGWADRERSELAAAGWIAVSLGSTILRAETAALTALAILSSVWEL